MRYITLVEVVLFAYLMWTIVNCNFKKKSYRLAALFRKKQKKQKRKQKQKQKQKQNKTKQNKTKQKFLHFLD